MPAFYPEGDEPKLADPSGRSLHKINNLLKSIDAKTGSTTITGPVTVSNEVEVTNSTGNPIPVSGTVGLDSTSLAALENISVTFPATQNVNVTNAGLSVSVSNLPATQPVSGSVSVSNLPATQAISGTIGTFNRTLVNAGTSFSYSTAGSYGLFDAGTDADYVEFTRDGGGGGFVHNISLSTSNSPFVADTSTASGNTTVFNDKFPSSSLDTIAYQFSNSTLQNGSGGNFVLSLTQGTTKYRYARIEVTGGGGGSWTGIFSSYKSLSSVQGYTSPNSNKILNRVPIAGVVDINSCTRTLPVSLASAPVTPVTDNGGSLTVDGSVSVSNFPATQPVSGTFWQTTQPVSIASVPSHPVTGSGSFTAAQATAANLNATVVGSGSFTAAQATASSLKAQAQILDSAGSLLTYAATGTAGTPAVDVVSVQGVSSGVAIAVSGPVTDTQLRASSIPVSDRGSVGQATVTTFTSTSSLVLMASNSARKLLTVFNEGAGVLYLLYGAGTASITNYSVRINSGDYLEIEKYTGAVTGIFGTAGTARATEIS
jgi:hypothetical protein